MRATLLAVVPLLLATTGASAQVPPEPNPYAYHRRELSPRPYGWKILIVDGTTTLTSIMVAQHDAAPVFFLGSYLLGGPIIHWAHGNVGTGFGSLALRAGAPLVGAYAGCAADNSSGMFGCLDGALLGMLVGYVTAITVDAAVFAYEDVSVEERVAKRSPTVFPSAALQKGSATFGLVATF